MLRRGEGDLGKSLAGDDTVGAQMWLIWSVVCAPKRGELGIEATLRGGSSP